MGFWRSLFGTVEVELTSADPGRTLLVLQKENIHLQDIEPIGHLQFRFRVSRTDFRTVRKIAKKRGETLRIVSRSGFYWTAKMLRKRPVLVPGRVFFIRVEGNQNIPSAQIIEQAQKSGISFGVSRREVRSEKMKNILLDRMPQLQWAGVNTYGCVAVITVRERSDPERSQTESGVSSILASRDAIVTQLTVLQGNALCKTGQAVKAGQVLVSGYTDCGSYIQAEQARAEIFGQTRRQLTAVSPLNFQFRREKTATQKNFSLIIGKKRINLWKGSGISGTSCARIETKYHLMLPGGFQLPVTWVTECFSTYDTQAAETENCREVLADFASSYLLEQMVAGQIIGFGQVFTDLEGLCRMDGSYDCSEMIGISRFEESLPNYGENN